MSGILKKMKDLVISEDLSCDPNAAWEAIKNRQKVEVITPLDPAEVPMSPDKVRFVCMSDTHTKTHELVHPVPEGDVLLHAGDFTQNGTKEEADKFNEWLGTLPHPHKVVIAGNHEILLDGESYPHKQASNPDEVLSNATYLNESGTSIYGLKIYGAPWTPIYHCMAFNLERGKPLRKRWAAIPDDVDILMTHGPPLGRGDLSWRQDRSGCVDLLQTVQKRVKPKYHIFGHIHEGYGMSTDGQTTFINAATCDVRYDPTHRPIVFDFPLPKGHTKKPSPS